MGMKPYGPAVRKDSQALKKTNPGRISCRSFAGRVKHHEGRIIRLCA